MPISQAGINKLKKIQAGFTLVEVLVVLFIFGIMASAVVLNLPSRKNPLYELGDSMATHLERTAQSSLINRETLGVRFTNKGYDIVRYNNGKWEEMQNFSFHQDFTPQIILRKNGTKIALKEEKGKDENNKEENELILPMIRYDTTGLATPFDLTLESDTSLIRLVGDHTGEISVKRDQVYDG